ncbi:FAD-dependent monooxygenase [Streptomyces sp. NPDC050738]|uniref:FAD-dependent monooxygenase n=1 Tax=Streptomyces sp. NPDC050738 TaxID=3154744 RepID=UPI0034348E15
MTSTTGKQNPHQNPHRNQNILISGASIAGPVLAYWLHHHGFTVTVVEVAPAPRSGGYAVDLRGPAMTVADRMGLLPALREHSTEMRDMQVVNAAGAPVVALPAAVFAGELEILKSDLTRLLYEATRDDVEYLFSDSVKELSEDDDGVDVTFENAASRRFDLVIGADGLHSKVRRLGFGPTADYLRPLDIYAAVWSVDNYLDLDHTGMSHTDGSGRVANILSAHHNAEARANFYFTHTPVDIDRRDTEAQKRLVTGVFANLGWEVPRLLEFLRDADDLYFTEAAQIHMPSWSKGRLALVGDAGFSAAPTSGRGTAQAVTAAYVLAGELAAAGGDHVAGFAAYEKEVRPYVEDTQRVGREQAPMMFMEPTQELIDALVAETPDEAPEVLALKEY